MNRLTVLQFSFKGGCRPDMIDPVYSLHDSCGKGNYFELSSTFLLVTVRLLFIWLELLKPCGVQSVR